MMSEDDKYERLMAGASTVWQVEAAARLTFFSQSLWRALSAGGFVRPSSATDNDLAIYFDEALDSLYGGGLKLSKSDRSVLHLAASIAGKRDILLRHMLPDLEEEGAKLVAEAIMYAAGFMDGEADPTAHDAPDGSNGPNWSAHERRVMGGE